MLQMEETSG